ncbi:hypothetical protein C8R45DRAFT_1069803 [Mycena sanguinolenta]|nr:hypothetical protein C8R45DRAFT_1069803 [Mycena sanguinolenta]
MHIPGASHTKKLELGPRCLNANAKERWRAIGFEVQIGPGSSALWRQPQDDYAKAEMEFEGELFSKLDGEESTPQKPDAKPVKLQACSPSLAPRTSGTSPLAAKPANSTAGGDRSSAPVATGIVLAAFFQPTLFVVVVWRQVPRAAHRRHSLFPPLSASTQRKLRWARFKSILFLANLVLSSVSIYALTALVFVIRTYLRTLPPFSVVLAANSTRGNTLNYLSSKFSHAMVSRRRKYEEKALRGMISRGGGVAAFHADAV